MAVDVSSDLDRALADLREIDADIAMITGRGNALESRLNRKRMAPNFASRLSFDSGDRRVQVDERRRLVISTGNDSEPGGRLAKRVRYSDDRENHRRHTQDEEEYERDSHPRRSIASSVVMPTIETKSRDAVISEMKKKENPEVVQRNRNMLNRLLVGTLKAFQKEEKIVRKVENVQAQKLEQVERRLEKTKQEDMDKIRAEKEELIAKRREKEKEIQRLKRTKAIQQYAEDKISHYKRLQNYIQTQTKPPLFYLPAKHTLRTLELLKTSAKKIDVLIEHRKEQMEKELKTDEEGSEDELDVGAVRSKVVTVADKTDEKEEKHDEALDGLGEPPLEEPMEEEETENVVKMRAASPVKRTVETKENGDKSIDQNQNERTNSSDESDGVSAAQKANQRRSTRSRSRSGSSAGSRSRSASRSSTGSGSSSGSSSSGESDEEE